MVAMQKALTGKDYELIPCKAIKNYSSFCQNADVPEILDLGHVGEVTEVNPAYLEQLNEDRVIPVIAPIGRGENGESLNINADFVAGKVASALRAEKLILLTNTPGVKKGGKLLTGLKYDEIRAAYC